MRSPMAGLPWTWRACSPTAPPRRRCSGSPRPCAGAGRHAPAPDRAGFDRELADAVAATTPDWVLCAGYMRILGSDFVRRFEGRLLNVHPSLLPRHKGLQTHARALEAGDAEHGASVQLVVPELDAGAVVAQATIPVDASDTPWPWPSACSRWNTSWWWRPWPRPAPAAWLNATVRSGWTVTPC